MSLNQTSPGVGAREEEVANRFIMLGAEGTRTIVRDIVLME
jgi:hypothetical protein